MTTLLGISEKRRHLPGLYQTAPSVQIKPSAIFSSWASLGISLSKRGSSRSMVPMISLATLFLAGCFCSWAKAVCVATPAARAAMTRKLCRIGFSRKIRLRYATIEGCVGRRRSRLLLRIQFPKPTLESMDPIDFDIRERAVEYREVIHVSDIGRPKHQQHLGGVPVERHVPFFDGALQLAVQVQLADRRPGFVVDVLQREDDVGPFVARERGTGDLDHRLLVRRDVGPLLVLRVPDVEERANGIAEEPRRLILGPFQEDVALLAVVADDLDRIAIARLQVLIRVQP